MVETSALAKWCKWKVLVMDKEDWRGGASITVALSLFSNASCRSRCILLTFSGCKVSFAVALCLFRDETWTDCVFIIRPWASMAFRNKNAKCLELDFWLWGLGRHYKSGSEKHEESQWIHLLLADPCMLLRFCWSVLWIMGDLAPTGKDHKCFGSWWWGLDGKEIVFPSS